MTTVLIEDSTNEGKWLLELIKNHKSVTIVEAEEKNMSFEEAAAECGAVSVDEFFDEVDRRIRKHYEQQHK